MAGIQVMRFEAKQKLGAQVQLVRHIDRTTAPETASDPAVISMSEPVELGPFVHLGGEGMAGARAALDAVLAKRSKRGRPPKECVDFLFAGPPPYVEPGAWSQAREIQWANETGAALRELVGPNSKIVTCDLHRDETSPHVQSVVVPIDGQGRLGWCHVRDEACKRLRPELDRMRAEAEKRIAQRRAAGEVVPDLPPPSTKSRYGVLQDWLYFRVSRRFGLERGVVGSRAKHEQIDRKLAAEAAAKRAELARRSAHAAAVGSEGVALFNSVVHEVVDDRREARNGARVADVEQQEADVERREHAVDLRERAGDERDVELGRREAAIVVCEARVRAGFAGLLRSAGELLRTHRRVLGRFSSWAQRLGARAATIERERLAARSDVRKLIANEYGELKESERKVREREQAAGLEEKREAENAKRERDAAIVQRDEAIAERVQAERAAGAAFGLDAAALLRSVWDLPERYGESYPDRVRDVLQACVAQRSPEPLFCAERASSSGKGRGRRRD